MTDIDIEITSEQIERITKAVEGIHNGPHRVLYNAVNRGLSKIRTQGTKEAAKVFTLKYNEIKSNVNISQRNASPGDNAIGEVQFSGNMIPLYKYKVTGSHKTGLSVSVKKGSESELRHAYVTNLGHGTNIFQRITRKRNSSETLFGPSVAHMVRNTEVESEIEKEAKKTIDERIDHEIERLLNGY